MAQQQQSQPSTTRGPGRNGWFGSQLGQIEYWLLLLACVCQIAAIFITWPLWQVRDSPPHLPLFDLPQIPFGILMIVSCLLPVFRPRLGVIGHALTLLAASAFDQFRLQPQIYAVCLLMFAMAWQSVAIYSRWILAALWFWAGLHKLLSPEWWGSASWWLIDRMAENAEESHVAFAAVIAISEIVLGVMAVFWPRWAAWVCLALHAGIIVFLSPVMIAYNYSVIPWNLATGVIGGYILWWVASPRNGTEPDREGKRATQQGRKQNRVQDSARPGRIQIAFAIAMFVMPIGFYRSWIDHGFAHVLYSGMLPKAMITTKEDHYQITGWGDLNVPFPSERRLYRLYFKQVAQPGDKLHICDPRPGLDDLYYVCDEDGRINPITRDAFYRGSESEPVGVGYDYSLSVFSLAKAGAKMHRRDERGAVFAIRFSPSRFEREQLRHLAGLPNLEQVQLAGTDVQDEDLRHLQSLLRLRGIGLNETAVSDEGIRHLRSLPDLRVVEFQGTEITEQGLESIGLVRVKPKD